MVMTDEDLRMAIKKLGTTRFLGCIPYRGGGAGVLAWPDEHCTKGDPVYEIDSEISATARQEIAAAGEVAVPVLIDEYRALSRRDRPASEEDEVSYSGMKYGILDCLRDIGTPDALSFIEEAKKKD